MTLTRNLSRKRPLSEGNMEWDLSPSAFEQRMSTLEGPSHVPLLMGTTGGGSQPPEESAGGLFSMRPRGAPDHPTRLAALADLP